MPDRDEIMDKLWDQDRRLVKVETELSGLHTQVATLRQQIDELIAHVGELRGSQKLILLFVGFGIPAIIGLELWNRLVR